MREEGDKSWTRKQQDRRVGSVKVDAQVEGLVRRRDNHNDDDQGPRQRLRSRVPMKVRKGSVPASASGAGSKALRRFSGDLLRFTPRERPCLVDDERFGRAAVFEVSAFASNAGRKTAKVIAGGGAKATASRTGRVSYRHSRHLKQQG